MTIISRCFNARSRLNALTQLMLCPLFTMAPESETQVKVKPAEGSWRLKYVTGNLFSCPEDEALAHCISEDCRMGAGIAVMFRKTFSGVGELKEQKKRTGQCAVLRRNRRFVYYLITKKRASQKPTYESLRQSLEDMKSHCLMNEVTRISVPRIGCGLDRLEWRKVSVILEEVFKQTNISITVYSLPEKAETKVMKENRHRMEKFVYCNI